MNVSDSDSNVNSTGYLQACADLNAYPAKINSSTKLEFVKGLYSCLNVSCNIMWIGLEDQSPNGTLDPKDYAWILDDERITDGFFGSQKGVYPWGNIEPNGINEKYVFIYSNGVFADAPSTFNVGYICEYTIN